MGGHVFKTIYWGDDQSTEVKFEAVNELPSKELVTACSVFALYRGNIVLSRPERGWGLPGGHREGNETAEECLLREADEEASIILENLRLIGRWATKKKFHSPHNEKYPDEGYQLLYLADVKDLKEFTPQFEIAERIVIPLSEVEKYHHDFAHFADIFHYTCHIINRGE